MCMHRHTWQAFISSSGKGLMKVPGTQYVLSKQQLNGQKGRLPEWEEDSRSFFFPVWPGMVLHNRDPSTQLGREDSELEARPGCIMKPVSNKQTNRQKYRSCRWELAL